MTNAVLQASLAGRIVVFRDVESRAANAQDPRQYGIAVRVSIINVEHNSSNQQQVVVIGGGITGLAAAHHLLELREQTKQNFNILLLEASSRLGGIIQTRHRDEFLLELGPDSFISEKPQAIALAKRIGIESHLIETSPDHRRSFIVRKGKLRPVPEGFQLLAPARVWSFIATDIFSWPGKARMAMDLLLPKRRNHGGDESLASFVRRRFGREALERMAQPMVGGIYTADPEQLSLRATFPRFLEMEQNYGSVIRGLRKTVNNPEGKRAGVAGGTSGARYSLFLSFDRGMQLLVDQLSSQMPSDSICLQTRVTSLRRDHSLGRWTLELSSRECLSADAVCLALPAFASASLLKLSYPVLARELESITYESTATVNLAYKREEIPHRLDGFGFVVPIIEGRSIIACTFSSVKFSGRAPKGYVLLRAFVGGALQPEMFALEEPEMIKRVKLDLEELLGVRTDPVFSEVTKWHNSMPQYYVGHLDRVRSIQDQLIQLPNLKLAGNGYSGAGLPDCIRTGEVTADELVNVFPPTSSQPVDAPRDFEYVNKLVL